jgi:hypothetical protein
MIAAAGSANSPQQCGKMARLSPKLPTQGQSTTLAAFAAWR